LKEETGCMIKVTIYKAKKPLLDRCPDPADTQQERSVYYGFDVEGHANFLAEGQDIVCAAVSMLVINTINSIERLTDDETSVVQDEDAARIRFRFANFAGHDAHLLVHSMILGLEDIENDCISHDSKFHSYIDIIFKEV